MRTEVRLRSKRSRPNALCLWSDTTAAFFCGFVRYVLQTPEVYKRLVAEIDEFERHGLLSTPVATFDQIRQMPYFSACHKETLRYQPSTPMIIPRYVSGDGLDLYGKHVPPGTEIGANPYVIHRDRAVFGEDADEFRPERWLEDHDKAQEMDRYILTWGYGPRICLGKNIALLETNKLLLQVSGLLIVLQNPPGDLSSNVMLGLDASSSAFSGPQ
jgi:cytochrome P450